jgi:hypothetical protein
MNLYDYYGDLQPGIGMQYPVTKNNLSTLTFSQLLQLPEGANALLVEKFPQRFAHNSFTPYIIVEGTEGWEVLMSVITGKVDLASLYHSFDIEGGLAERKIEESDLPSVSDMLNKVSASVSMINDALDSVRPTVGLQGKLIEPTQLYMVQAAILQLLAHELTDEETKGIEAIMESITVADEANDIAFGTETHIVSPHVEGRPIHLLPIGGDKLIDAGWDPIKGSTLAELWDEKQITMTEVDYTVKLASSSVVLQYTELPRVSEFDLDVINDQDVIHAQVYGEPIPPPARMPPSGAAYESVIGQSMFANVSAYIGNLPASHAELFFAEVTMIDDETDRTSLQALYLIAILFSYGITSTYSSGKQSVTGMLQQYATGRRGKRPSWCRPDAVNRGKYRHKGSNAPSASGYKDQRNGWLVLDKPSLADASEAKMKIKTDLTMKRLQLRESDAGILKRVREELDKSLTWLPFVYSSDGQHLHSPFSMAGTGTRIMWLLSSIGCFPNFHLGKQVNYEMTIQGVIQGWPGIAKFRKVAPFTHAVLVASGVPTRHATAIHVDAQDGTLQMDSLFSDVEDLPALVNLSAASGIAIDSLKDEAEAKISVITPSYMTAFNYIYDNLKTASYIDRLQLINQAGAIASWSYRPAVFGFPGPSRYSQLSFYQTKKRLVLTEGIDPDPVVYAEEMLKMIQKLEPRELTVRETFKLQKSTAAGAGYKTSIRFGECTPSTGKPYRTIFKPGGEPAIGTTKVATLSSGKKNVLLMSTQRDVFDWELRHTCTPVNVPSTSRRDDTAKAGKGPRIINIIHVKWQPAQAVLSVALGDYQKKKSVKRIFLNKNDFGNIFNNMMPHLRSMIAAMASARLVTSIMIVVGLEDFPAWDQHQKTAVIKAIIYYFAQDSVQSILQKKDLVSFIPNSEHKSAIVEVNELLGTEEALFSSKEGDGDVAHFKVGSTTSGDNYTANLNSGGHHEINRIEEMAEAKYNEGGCAALIEFMRSTVKCEINPGLIKMESDVAGSSVIGDDGILRRAITAASASRSDRIAALQGAQELTAYTIRACGHGVEPADVVNSQLTGTLTQLYMLHSSLLRRFRFGAISLEHRRKLTADNIVTKINSLVSLLVAGNDRRVFFHYAQLFPAIARHQTMFGKVKAFSPEAIFRPSFDGDFVSLITAIHSTYAYHAVTKLVSGEMDEMVVTKASNNFSGGFSSYMEASVTGISVTSANRLLFGTEIDPLKPQDEVAIQRPLHEMVYNADEQFLDPDHVFDFPESLRSISYVASVEKAYYSVLAEAVLASDVGPRLKNADETVTIERSEVVYTTDLSIGYDSLVSLTDVIGEFFSTGDGRVELVIRRGDSRVVIQQWRLLEPMVIAVDNSLLAAQVIFGLTDRKKHSAKPLNLNHYIRPPTTKTVLAIMREHAGPRTKRSPRMQREVLNALGVRRNAAASFLADLEVAELNELAEDLESWQTTQLVELPWSPRLGHIDEVHFNVGPEDGEDEAFIAVIRREIAMLHVSMSVLDFLNINSELTLKQVYTERIMLCRHFGAEVSPRAR